ncbi:MAG: hypothetical protein M1832_004532 [Thelocarpon impressellum]|nr:MAG: hypothetical protein M1832_004532 [Thelocarpon impressellum]
MDPAETAPSQAPSGQGPYESDAEDSTYGDMESLTASITSSIVAYETEHGRRYHAYQSGKYVLPNDEAEQDRLDLQYHSIRIVLDDKLFLAPVKNPQAILDVGTGTGIWAIDTGDAYPAAEIIGTDLSPIQPKWVPPNVKFEVDDAEEPWTYPRDNFDLVHSRVMVGSIKNWPQFLEQSYRHLKPGGWLEMQEIVVDIRTDDDSFLPNSAIQQWCALLEDAVQKVGFSLRLDPAELRRWMEEAGFVDVTVLDLKLPMGLWPADEKLREAGKAQLLATLEGAYGLTVAVWTRMLNKPVEELEVFLAGMRNELKTRSVHCYWPLIITYGRKPDKEGEQAAAPGAGEAPAAPATGEAEGDKSAEGP